MQLTNKVAIIHAAAGAVGSTLARAFAREGARVYLAGRRGAAVQALGREITAAGGEAHAAEVDAIDEKAIDKHLAAVLAAAGRIDIAFNAIGIPQLGIQGTPLTALAVERFMQPVETYARSQFLTARAAARVMTEQRSGAIVFHTPSPARAPTPHVGGMALAWAAIESLAQLVSAETAALGVRTVCLRTTGLPETRTIDTVYGLHATALGVEPAQFRAMIESRTHRLRSNTLDELADAAVFAVSDRGRAFTGTTLNLTGGLTVD